MSDDSDAYASADESLHASAKADGSTVEYPKSNIGGNLDSNNCSTPNVSSKSQVDGTPLCTKKSHVETARKKVRQKKPKSTPKKCGKVKEAPMNHNSETGLKEETTSVIEDEDKSEKFDQKLPMCYSYKKVEASFESIQSKAEILNLDEVEDSANYQKDVPTNIKEDQDTGKPSQHIYGPDGHSQTDKLTIEQTMPATSSASGDINLTNAVQFHTTMVKPPKIEHLTELEFITSAASNIARGLGDGITSLVGALSDVIQGNLSEDETPKRRAERQSEEECERKAISDAWNSVWNTSWTNDDNVSQNDGWEVNSIDESVDAFESQPENINSSVSKESKHNSSCGEQIPSSTEKRDVEQETSSNNFSWGWSGLSSFSQQLTSSLQATSLNLVQGGVDVLELIGRKTMSVLAENDPGFKYTKKFLRPPNAMDNRPNLSKMLREAYELHTSESNNQKSVREKRGDFTYQLEYYRALLHLESLELVSEQASDQLHTRLDYLTTHNINISEHNNNINHDNLLEAIWTNLNSDEIENDDKYNIDDHRDNDNDDDISDTKIYPTGDSHSSIINKFSAKHSCDHNHAKRDKSDHQRLPENLNHRTVQLWSKIIEVSDCLNLVYSNERFLKATTDIWKSCCIDVSEQLSTEEIYFQSISSLAQFTSAYLEYLHKFSECIIVRIHKSDIDFVELSKILSYFFRLSVEAQVCLCQEFIKNIKSLREQKSMNLVVEQAEDSPVITNQLSTSQYVSNLLLECSNAGNYLKNAANLLIPVIQLACLNHIYPSTLLTTNR
ncbi:hypothetical protein MN116_005650 [Schistosoma mekongi]|uniref:Protein FAM114A2 n=1 Tax=Schistosoma mekongi TaxID=38744 RepID=A0AAE1ZB64_SCHME|nr:hypothetical protein MN116_005650 [Schistosoma mekongi]